MTDNMLDALNRITEYNKQNGIIDVTILADSINEVGDRITSFLLNRFPKGACQAELNKHRTIANNSFSSRAVNKTKYTQMIEADPYVPIWTYNRPGMMGDLVTDEDSVEKLTAAYLNKMKTDIEYVSCHYDDIHKQDTNAQLDHYSRIPIIVTSTNFPYFFDLRTTSGVKPEFRRIALIMQDMYNQSQPKTTNWHIPWIAPEEETMGLDDKLIMCAARSAWLSYSSHYKQSTLNVAKNLVDKLIVERHHSVFDHAAISEPNRIDGIYTGWKEHRQLLNK